MTQHYISILTSEEQALIVSVAQKTIFKQCPRWLGNFDFKCYYKYSWEKTLLAPIIERLGKFYTERFGIKQDFNTAFLQRYVAPHGFVAKHRDPKNNTGVTIIAIAGEYTGAIMSVKAEAAQRGWFVTLPGDIIVQNCTINGVQGPKHWVSPVNSGIKYSLILNTIRD